MTKEQAAIMVLAADLDSVARAGGDLYRAVGDAYETLGIDPPVAGEPVFNSLVSVVNALRKES